MAQGSFTVPLRDDAPFTLVNTCAEYGHVVITDQWLEPDTIGDAALLSAARYTGVVLRREYDSGEATISGAGHAWWLGDEDDVGDILESKVSLSGATLDTCLTNILPPSGSITKGTVNNTGVNYTGQFQWVTPLSAIRTVCAAVGAEWRINPNGTLDAATASTLFTYDVPQVVVVRTGWGSDPNFTGLPSDQIRSVVDGYRYANKVHVLQDDLDGTFTSQGNDTTADSYLDIHGNAMQRTAMVVESVVDSTSLTSFLSNELAERVVDDRQDIDTSQLHADASFSVGDRFYCYDPPYFVDTSNEVQYRGDTIWPKIIRLLEASWALTPGMGVYYRASDATYTDLTRHIRWDRNT
jgi:hypothetical protein